MNRIRQWVVLGVIAMFVLGCGVSRDEYIKLEDQNKVLGENLERLHQGINQITRQNEELSYTNQNLQNEVRRLQQERDALQARLGAKTEGTAESEEESFGESFLK